MLKVKGITGEQQTAVDTFLQKHDLHIDGEIKVIAHAKNGWMLERDDGGDYVVYIGKPVHLFRVLSILGGQAIPIPKRISEDCSFNSLALSIDVSQGNCVLRVETIRDLILYLAAMGYDRLFLYSEDSYPLGKYPYFGHMRAQYTIEQLSEIDDFASSFGIELIPCLQTLAHFTSVLRWQPFKNMAEDAATLLVGADETYDFIEEMVASASRIFRSRYIHIGCDEAWNLGLGNYFFKHGLRPKSYILKEHLDRVLGIVKKYGLTAMMWSDMFFRLETPQVREEYCVPPTGHFSEATIKSVPRDVQLVYWEYIRDEESVKERLNLHGELTDNLAVAGHIRNNRSVGSNYSLTFRATGDMMRACKDYGIPDVIATIWGDDAPESNIYAALLGMQLFAEYQFQKDPDKDSVYSAFRRCVQAEPEDFFALTFFDEIPQVHGGVGNQNAHNPSRWLLWQDPLLGLFDANISGLALDEHYREQAVRMRSAAERNTRFRDIFRYYQLAAEVLSKKATLGLELYDAYETSNMSTLSELANRRIPDTCAAVYMKPIVDYGKKRAWKKAGRSLICVMAD